MVGLDDLKGKAGGVVGGVAEGAERLRRQAGGVAEGMRSRFGRSEPKPLDDVTITRKVESIVFRQEDAAKDKVSVNTVDGVVHLHGEVRTPAQVKALEAAVRAIPEVREVENLLHLPKTPAPTRADAPRSQQKTRTTKPRSASPRAAERVERVNADTTVARGEPTPAELAEEGTGRKAAPLGSEDPEPEQGGAGRTAPY